MLAPKVETKAILTYSNISIVKTRDTHDIRVNTNIVASGMEAEPAGCPISRTG